MRFTHPDTKLRAFAAFLIYFSGDKQSQYKKLLETTEEEMKEEIYNKISSIIDEKESETV